MIDPVAQGWLGWALAIALGVPLALVVLTEILNALQRRRHPAVKPVRLLRNWVVPAVGLLILVVFAVRSPADQVWVRVVATVVGFLSILLLLSAFNVAIFGNARPDSWRGRLPSIFVDIARLLLVVVGVALLFQWVWGADVGGLVAALGVTSIVIGLALQNAVGSVISGLLLLFEQPFQIGDWLDGGGVQGRVTEVNWRAVHIDTGSGIQIVPNAVLAGSSFRNLSRPPGAHHASLTLAFSTADTPHDVMRLLVEVAERVPGRVTDEPPSVDYLGTGKYLVSLPLQGPADVARATSVYLGWLWYAARRRGLSLDGDGAGSADPTEFAAALGVVASTLHLTDQERDSLAEASGLERYGTGEVVQAAGTVPEQIRFVVAGRVRLVSTVGGERTTVAQLERGDYLGQTALTREADPCEALVAETLTVLAVPLGSIDALVRQRPLLATEIGELIESRRALVQQRAAVASGSTSLNV
ncbi:mechanosensitive ion channel domain-containing protein [Pseudactinotalea sp.]|uniref:mechanosensitive ion channel domain-containing protein n=1 Tax=Pseudactinotalea sp. TaxID=1926260 RepID=UPI003B3BB75C